MDTKALRRKILDLAIRGRLVPQDPADEPASVLLQRIRAEKARLVREGKLKKSAIDDSVIFRDQDNKYYEKKGKTLTCIDEEIPFEIPETWEWVKIGTIFAHNNGKQLNKSNSKGKLLEYITTSNLYWDGFKLDDLKKMPFEEYEIERCQALKGDLLVCEGGDVGRSCIWPYNTPIMLQNHIHKLRAYYPLCTKYFFYVLYEYNLSGRIGGKGIGIQGFSSNALHNTHIPLPPLPEQHRIVSKLEELMSVVERYEKAQDELDVLCNSLNGRLRKSILQEAIRGRLVPQDPTDEPASVLLQRIRAEKARLVREGKLKKSAIDDSVIFRGQDNKYYEKKGKTLTCIDEEIPFEIPETWEWCRFGNIMINRDGERVPLSVSQRQSLDKVYDYYGASGVIDKVDKYLFDKDLLLIGEDGANLLNRSTPIAFIAKGEYWVNNHAHVLDACGGLNLPYMSMFINAISLADYITGTAQPKMNQKMMNSILIPLSPLPEQHRIVSKVEELFGVLDRLASR